MVVVVIRRCRSAVVKLARIQIGEGLRVLESTTAASAETEAGQVVCRAVLFSIIVSVVFIRNTKAELS